MKPVHIRPFNIEHAKAGAPYSCASGEAAQILKWDCNRAALPILGVVGKQDMNCRRDIDGSACIEMGDDYRLVMLPIFISAGRNRQGMRLGNKRSACQHHRHGAEMSRPSYPVDDDEPLWPVWLACSTSALICIALIAWALS